MRNTRILITIAGTRRKLERTTASPPNSVREGERAKVKGYVKEPIMGA